MRKAIFLLAIALLVTGTFAQETTQGTLYAVTKKGSKLGACPLKNTVVRADISGFLARVNVRQEFENSFAQPIEAIYTFPLSQNGAVDQMTMTIGSRVVRGKIMKRVEARAVYETAKAAGQAASLLDQERPNIFTQAVANIMPGEKVVIEISYVETLKYEDGAYEFVFPMTVGPRYIPGSVVDASKIKPPVAEATRTGHDISVEVNLNAGVPVEAVRSDSHRIEQLNFSPAKSKITLHGEKTIPNKDFILRYDVTGKRLEDGVLAHRDKRGGFFTLVLQPPDTVAPEDRTPKEIVFVLDTSGSMSGFPIEKAKEAMKLSLDGLYPEDTFNLITFAGDTRVLFEEPVPATQANLDRAQAFLESRQGGGGTEMMKAIKAALDPSDSQEHLRIVCFMTDAFVGNDNEIIAEIQKHPMARVFSFGIGSSVNRALLDKMAEAGNGEVEYVGLQDDGSKAARKFYERVRTPMLTDLSIDWSGLPVTDFHPNKIGDLFSAKPVIVNGRYTKGGTGTIKLKGKVAGQPYERSINVTLPETEPANDVLATLWARRRVDELSMESLKGGTNAEIANKEIENLGLDFRIMTAFTSFVAVEEQIVNHNGEPTRVDVPVAIPEGVNKIMATGEADEVVKVESSGGGGGGGKALTFGNARRKSQAVANSPANVSSLTLSPGATSGSGSGRGTGSGSGSGSGGGSGTGSVNASTAQNAVVNVTSSVEVAGDTSSRIDMRDTSITTTISRQTVASLPPGTTYSSLLALPPGAAKSNFNGKFQVDGASGSESTFIVDGQALGETRSGSNNSTISTLHGKTVAAAEPVYPDEARKAKALGVVEVEVYLDTSGTVTSAKAITGHRTLRVAAESAAMLSKFAPVLVNGRSVRITGQFIYRFRTPEKVEVFVSKMRALPYSDEEKKLIALGEKLHTWVYALVDGIATSKAPATSEEMFVNGNKAALRIVLKTRSAETLEKLRALGFEPLPSKDGVNIDGLLPVNKIVDAAALEQVKLILPKT